MKKIFNKKRQYMKKILISFLCHFGFHYWVISKWCNFKDNECKYLNEEGFDRECQWCGKTQRLMKPKIYHPTKYVWTDISNEL